MFNYLAESDFPDARIIIAVIFVVFGALKWLSENVFTSKKNETKSRDEIANELEDAYERYRAEIVNRQTTVQEQPQTHVFQEPQHSPAPPPPTIITEQPTPTPQPPKKTQLTEAEQLALEQIQSSSLNHSSAYRKKEQKPETLMVRKLLKTPGSVQTAIVLQDILGKPKSLR